MEDLDQIRPSSSLSLRQVQETAEDESGSESPLGRWEEEAKGEKRSPPLLPITLYAPTPRFPR